MTLVHDFLGDDATPWEREVLDKNGLLDWRVQRVEGNEGMCWVNPKVIQCTHSLALFLHEVAHALRSCDDWGHDSAHDGRWGDHFTRLVTIELAELEAEVAYEQERNRNNVLAYSQELDELKAEVERLMSTVHNQVVEIRQAEAKLARVVEAAQMLGGAVGDVLAGWDAHRHLDAGHTGMGHNILIETAGQYKSISCWIRVRRYYDALCAALAAAKGEPEPHAFEPCREGDEGDDPAHNFTCALLCTVCGLPREKHAQ